ncbi:Zinc finger BED-type predicted [Penicillium frequentans]|uniref:Zinc finger BED-type predicted n=1 Tax=Penicillium frequentans TaxID=3151616 RepID=A0AAD6CYQ2_9EURO|nr:Zinc finger BED-type predicted [Penicillium glabrum]
MGKKRRGPSLEELLARPWCYYCERDFDDLKILTLHQKAKHFKCERCGRRLNTAGGLSVHMSQVHKEQLTEIENALPNRAGLDYEIFGMEGIPDDVLQAHHQRVATQFQQAEVERQVATGNPPAGGSSGGPAAKKPKLEPVSDLKKRLAEHRAKRADGAAGGSSGEATPVGAGLTPSASTPGTISYCTCAWSIAIAYSNPFTAIHLYRTLCSTWSPPPVAPYQQIASPGFPPFSPTGIQPGPGSMGYNATGYSPQPFSGPPGYGAPSPAYPSQQSTPTENTPPRPGSLPIPSGLPQRPAFAAPPVNAQQMQQMHMGHPMAQPPVPSYSNGDAARATPPIQSVNDTPGATNDVTEKPVDGTEKPSKKDKAKPTRMIYSDQTVSPEEKMAQIPRYAFSRDRFTQETVLGEIPDATVTGTIRDQDTVVDPAH